MSRIGKKPIEIPASVKVDIAQDGTVTVKGPKGTLSEQVKGGITIKEEGNQLILERPSDDKNHRALHGLYRALVHNMVVGVTDGFAKTLETPAPTKIVIKGINKQQVGNLAADIRAIRKPEPYLGKGIKYENEHIRRKEGKAGK